MKPHIKKCGSTWYVYRDKFCADQGMWPLMYHREFGVICHYAKMVTYE